MQNHLSGRRGFVSALASVALTSGAVPILDARNERPTILSVRSTQRALIHLGYLPPDAGTAELDSRTQRALIRFKRHARRTYRMSASSLQPGDVAPHLCFGGACDASLDAATSLELSSWLARGWTLPLGRFPLVSIPPTATRLDRRAMLRQDVAALWLALIGLIRRQGGTIDGPYGDTWRPLGFHGKDGVSARSFHIAGRAIDLNQHLAHQPFQRYYLAPEPSAGSMYFRIWCRTRLQDGSQGKYLSEGSLRCWRGNAPLFPVPSGWYLDLTSVLEQHGFERISAQPGWEGSYLRTEWWHYQYSRAKQDTFLDECELVGIGESHLLRAGYSFADMDRPPG